MCRPTKTYSPLPNVRALVADQGRTVCQKYGPRIGWRELLSLLEDRACVHFPCEVKFDAGSLLPGEFAHSVAKGPRPEDGYTICLHPLFTSQLSSAVYLVLHQLVLVNHGRHATPEDAEVFGSLALGLSRDEYFSALCELSGQLGGDELI